LEVGVGTHHGALPRPFLNTIEELLDARKLSIVVASPTLAQGIDLACSVLIFRSLKRFEDGEWVAISPAEFANVVGRAGRAYVDLDGIAVLPTFTGGQSRSRQHALFSKLIEKSRGQRLLSGLAQLVWQISKDVRQKLNVPEGAFLEYVLNHNDLWSDTRLAAEDAAAEDEDEVEDSLEKYVADLDIALFSLIEPLDTQVEHIATTLDEVLKDSLWKRTLAHLPESQQDLEHGLLKSRAEWLWRNSTLIQRKACFFSGLGRKPGLFIHEKLDALIDVLSTMQKAVATKDSNAAADGAVKFAQLVMPEPFFSVRKLPTNWERAQNARRSANAGFHSGRRGFSPRLGGGGSASTSDCNRSSTTERTRRWPSFCSHVWRTNDPCRAFVPDGISITHRCTLGDQAAWCNLQGYGRLA
jgi:hypothetical protein